MRFLHYLITPIIKHGGFLLFLGPCVTQQLWLPSQRNWPTDIANDVTQVWLHGCTEYRT